MNHPTPETPKSRTPLLSYITRFSATEKAVFGLFVVITVVSALIMMVWVSDHFSQEVPTYGGTLREGVIGLPRNINPILAITDVDRDLSTLVYSGLMKYSGGEIVPDLAASYEVSDDGLTYTFTLKPRLSFQDGTSLTTEDIAFTIQKIQDPALKSPRRADWADVAVKVASPTEIQFTLKQAYSPFLANTTIGILPKHVWGSVGDEQFIFSQYNIEPIGSGPYEVTSITRDSGGIPTHYKLATWRGYYDTRPFLESINFHFFSEESAALVALDQGIIDSIASISPEAAEQLASDTAQAYTIISEPLPRIFGVFLNQNQAPVLADKVVRQALDMSVDREALIKTVLKGYGVAIKGPTPLSISTSSTAVTTPAAASTTWSSTNAAQALLEKNGWVKDAEGVYTKKVAKSPTLTLAFDIYTVDTPDLRLAAELVRDSWNAIGARVGIKVHESTDLYQNIIRTRKYDALLFGEVIGKGRDLYAFWHSSQRITPGLNIALYTNSKTDKLLEEIRVTSDEETRNAKYAQFDQLIRTDLPAIFLYMPDFIYAIPKSVHNIDIRSMSIPSDRWNNVGNWYRYTENVWNVFIK